jgi:hypothetical protein
MENKMSYSDACKSYISFGISITDDLGNECVLDDEDRQRNKSINTIGYDIKFNYKVWQYNII